MQAGQGQIRVTVLVVNGVPQPATLAIDGVQFLYALTSEERYAMAQTVLLPPQIQNSEISRVLGLIEVRQAAELAEKQAREQARINAMADQREREAARRRSIARLVVNLGILVEAVVAGRTPKAALRNALVALRAMFHRIRGIVAICDIGINAIAAAILSSKAASKAVKDYLGKKKATGGTNNTKQLESNGGNRQAVKDFNDLARHKKAGTQEGGPDAKGARWVTLEDDTTVAYYPRSSSGSVPTVSVKPPNPPGGKVSKVRYP